jgi:16S rRNA (guanine(966)-N(2))-methyltransferase RsmD
MRIIAGTAKGRVLRSLRGKALRPTAARVRESLFGALEPRVRGARFLDLYAGAGTVGLEAISRGAAGATFVEFHRPAARIIRENAERCGFEDRVRVVIAPVARGLARLRKEGMVFDLVFVDPPYGGEQVGAVMSRLGHWSCMLSQGGLVLCQHSRHEEVGGAVGDLVGVRRMRFGETVVDFYQRGGEAVDDGALCRDV